VTRRDAGDLLLLAGLWGASFLFMRVGAAEFGPLPLAFVRLGGGALLLLPLALAQGHRGALRQHWRAIASVGLVNSALPFVLFSLAALALGTALMSVFNATASIWGALIAWAWLGERPTRSRLLGLGLGIAGVVGLSWGKADFRPGDQGVSPALGIAACLGAAVLYGFAANLSRKQLTGVPPVAAAAGSLVAAAVLLVVPAALTWPARMPGPAAWAAAGALALLCTAVAYLLYFRLLARAGTTVAMSVTFLIPAFAIAWGWLFLGERPTVTMLGGCAVILLGTALATGAVGWPRRGPRST
jgi:drug/metabolite transporter (DMT)-like permease